VLTEDLWRRDPRSLETMLRAALAHAQATSLPAKTVSDLEVSLAYSLIHQRRFADAHVIITATLNRRPDHDQARWCEAQLAFFNDEPWPVPWRKLDARWAVNVTGQPPTIKQHWDGSRLDGKAVLMVGEGGMGDEIQFVRFAPLLKAKGASKVVICTDPRLVPLFESVDAADCIVARMPRSSRQNDLLAYDVGCSMMSLPGLLRTTLETLPFSVPYLQVPRDRIEATRRHIQQHSRQGRLNVGLFWHSHRPDKRIPLRCFSPLAEVDSVNLFAIGDRAVVANDLGECHFPIVDLGSEEQDITSTAAAISALDLTISVDSMGAHLAGSLGRPVWLILHYVPDWRWPVTGETTPWYPTMRIFRQEGSHWESAIRSIVWELSGLVSSHRRARTATCST
jgi:hypothetical protein